MGKMRLATLGGANDRNMWSGAKTETVDCGRELEHGQWWVATFWNCYRKGIDHNNQTKPILNVAL